MFARRCTVKKMFLKNLQNSLKNIRAAVFTIIKFQVKGLKFMVCLDKIIIKNSKHSLTFLYQQLPCLNDIAIIENRNKNAIDISLDLYTLATSIL